MTENNNQANKIRRCGRGFFTEIPGITDSQPISASALNKNNENISASALTKNIQNSQSHLLSASALTKTQILSASALTKEKEESEIDKLLELTEEEKQMNSKEVTKSMEKLILEEDTQMEVDEWAKKETWGETSGTSTFENQGFSTPQPQKQNEGFEKVKRKNKKNLISVSTLTQAKKDNPRGKRYVICQLQEHRLIAVAPNPIENSQWPFSLRS